MKQEEEGPIRNCAVLCDAKEQIKLKADMQKKKHKRAIGLSI